MARYGVAEAKDGLSKLIDKAAAGEEVLITRHGHTVAELRPVPATPTIADRKKALARLAALRASMPPLGISASELVSQMRDEDAH